MRTAWPALTRALPPALATAVLVAALYAVSRWHYLLFHSIIELLGVVASLGIFMVAWNTRRTHRTGFLLFLGQAYLFIAALDLLHALAYKGMGVFPGGGANLPTQLWIAARAFESVALLIAPLFVARAVPLAGTLLGSGAVAGALAAAIFSGHFPACFVEGQGLTGFKIGSEYAIVLTLAGALALLARRKGRFEPTVFRALALSLVFKIGTEVSFTLYNDVYGFSNLIGHLLKLVSIALIYRALVETAIA
ncbi:MAG TPA: MASE3 domain-containing protein, partial [bacterium]